MRKLQFAAGEYYHIYNRGVEHRTLFLDDRDRVRFMYLLLHAQGNFRLQKVGNAVTYFLHNKSFPTSKRLRKSVIEQSIVEIVHFTLMPNHFHLLLGERTEGGISKFMHRLELAYSKYFNARYQRTGHLFEGTFKSVQVKGNNQLLYLSTYIHKNPRSIREWRGHEREYPFSSYLDCVSENRWQGLLRPGVVLSQFRSPVDYKKFVESSPAKTIERFLDKEHLDLGDDD